MIQIHKIVLSICFSLSIVVCLGQVDSSSEHVLDSFLLRQKGLLGKLSRNLVANKPAAVTSPVRNDLLFEKFKGKIIRRITIVRVDFGTPITDTSKHSKNAAAQFASSLHHKTREGVIRNNLFLKPGDQLMPDLVADNERHLRDLPFLHDAKISIQNVGTDSVDIVVVTKDVLSIGGSLRLHDPERVSVSVSEANLAGTGHELLGRILFDNTRDPKVGYGGEYIGRNAGGSFINWYLGYINFNSSFNTGRMNEEMTYGGLVRPLVNPYIKFTYAAELAWHNTMDVYPLDTFYQQSAKYKYYNYDAWVGWNTGAFKFSNDVNRDRRTRTLIGLRYLQHNFNGVPQKYEGDYYYGYATFEAVLSSVSVFRQDFYKSQYVYGFGRNEDIPEGIDLSFTTGWTKKANVQRPYLGIDVQRFFFTAKESYFHYTFKADGYLRNKRVEDINLLANVDYFSRLLRMGKWSQRTFVTGGAAHQIDRVLNVPLFLQSDFGVREWRSDTLIGGDTRIDLKVEPVFFAPWSPANFRFAPFVFADICLFTPVREKFSNSVWYNSLGAGIRMRNESLIFETVELRAFYFPRENFLGEHWRIEFNTGLRFKYNRQYVKKPDLVNVNVM
ncbi:MAG: hypothetical protein E6H10_17845 [Bacteroidetes bacterium]|nr:MAG: hypothetical protein E6H10_17845 [Bacteroidota bacterium]